MKFFLFICLTLSTLGFATENRTISAGGKTTVGTGEDMVTVSCSKTATKPVCRLGSSDRFVTYDVELSYDNQKTWSIPDSLKRGYFNESSVDALIDKMVSEGSCTRF